MASSILRRLTTAAAAQPLPLIALTWLAQLVLGVAMAKLLPIPERPLVIERSGCGEAQWQALIGRYQHLLAQHQLGQRHWRPVVVFNALAEERHGSPPDPSNLIRGGSVGDRDPRQELQLRQNYPSALWLRCKEN